MDHNQKHIYETLLALQGKMRFSKTGAHAFLNLLSQQLQSSCKGTKFYRRFKDRYVAPEGFRSWQEAMLDFSKYTTPQYIIENTQPVSLNAAGIGLSEGAKGFRFRENTKVTLHNAVAMTAYAYFHKSPAIYIGGEMCKALANTEVLAGLEPEIMLDSFFICLPKGFAENYLGLKGHGDVLLCQTANARLSGFKKLFNAFGLICPDYEGQFYPDVKSNTIVSFSCLKSAFIYSQHPWKPVGSNYLGGDLKNNANDTSVDRLSNLIRNAVLLYCNEKKYVFNDKKRRIIHQKGFAGQTITAQYPITWLGKNYQLKRTAQNSIDLEQPKRLFKSHWRKGHWHHYWTGTGREEKILKWVQPTYIKGVNLHS
tara:strand:- start:651 stop:1754 length:1104 start_codon:yes stop_codon:yes gene_type:complete